MHISSIVADNNDAYTITVFGVHHESLFCLFFRGRSKEKMVHFTISNNLGIIVNGEIHKVSSIIIIYFDVIES